MLHPQDQLTWPHIYPNSHALARPQQAGYWHSLVTKKTRKPVQYTWSLNAGVFKMSGIIDFGDL
jgi:hypothetical protein